MQSEKVTSGGRGEDAAVSAAAATTITSARELGDKRLTVPREVARGEPPESMLATKALRALMLLAKHAGLEAGCVYSARIEVLRDLFSCRDDQALRAAFETLRGRTWKWPGLSNQEGWTSPIPSVLWSRGSPIIEWEISAMFLRSLRGSSNKGYIVEDWLELREYQSLYGLRLYEYVSSHQHHETKEAATPAIGIEELRTILGVPTDAYRGPQKEGQPPSTVGAFWQKSIHPAVKEIKRINGMDIELKRAGRGATGVYWFEVTNAHELRDRSKQMLLTDTLPPVTKRKIVVQQSATADLAERCERVLESMSRAARDKVRESLRALNLPDQISEESDDTTVKVFASGLRRLGIEIPAPETLASAAGG